MLGARRNLIGEQFTDDEAERCAAVAEGNVVAWNGLGRTDHRLTIAVIGLPPTPMEAASSFGLPSITLAASASWASTTASSMS
jgi:hypothetical protein